MKVSPIIAGVALLACTACTPEQLAWWQTASTDDRTAVVEHIVRDAAAEFGVDGDRLVRLGVCESGLRPDAKNPRSTARGVFQYLDRTWTSARTRLYDRGIDPAPYEEADVWNPVAQARITANVISEGGASWWECRY